MAFELNCFLFFLFDLLAPSNKYVPRGRTLTAAALSQLNKNTCGQIRSVPSHIRNDLRLKYFYQKYTEAYGIPVLASNKVNANAMRRACYVLRFFLADRDELRELFYKRNVRVVVLAAGETLLNVPELTHLTPPSIGSQVRGLSPTLQTPLVVVGEENLLCNNDHNQ